MVTIAAQLCALFTALLGIGAVFAPMKVAHMLSLDVLAGKVEGKTEIRATLGGLFLFAGLFTVYVNTPIGYATLGAAWLGVGLVRVIMMFPDKAVTRFMLMSVAIELFVAFWMLLPWLLGQMG